MPNTETLDIGTETLRRMRTLSRYSAWVVERVMSWVGDSVLEIGAGIGNNAPFFIDRNRLVLTDINEDYIQRLREDFGHHPNVAIERFDIEDSGAHLAGYDIDTVIAFNVLEHIRNDRNALTEIAGILSPGGRIILQLPAHPALYGSLDRHLNHYRRYTAQDIREKLVSAGLVVEQTFHMNMFGAAGWFVSSRLLGRAILPKGQLGLFNVLTPVFIAIERIVPPPFGLSIIAVARKDT